MATRLMTVRVPDELQKAVAAMAKRQKVSVSEQIRHLIEAGLEAQETGELRLKQRIDELEKRVEKLESSWQGF